jgi:ABC-type dipeptide/oligopeptide/nickel transport system permease component
MPLLYLTSRLGQGAVVVFGALVISFLLGALAGDPADVIAGASGLVTPEQKEAIREQLGYGDPLPVRFLQYVGDTLQADLGTSYRSGEPALGVVLTALPNTLLLVSGALLAAAAIAVPLSLWSALRRERLDDRWMRRALVVTQGMPEFWLALMLVLLFSVLLGWLPSIGFDGPSSMILPVAALAAPLVPTLVRLIRAQLLDVMQLEFVVALRAKGFSDLSIAARHGLRNVLPGMLTFLALQAGWLVGGTLVVESVFGWPGLGSLLLDAVQTRDLALVQAGVLVIALAYVVLNLAADLMVLALDPRVRVGAR